ncbi:hypothetical protein GCM10019059_36200 [Camelimonas fluminis]|uniref:PilJ/NarX-like methyl-accepting chemotaxis transducer n=1 Tax=Camelimonas fluminis TaxID=1576911 RepID=A0ABV7UHD9_9HYPH|nr:hypothetical protein [Camelimonas fluminis]GHE73363.1 hypothetical protein GCM10019059_36200 [Camelimonas fluminis]
MNFGKISTAIFAILINCQPALSQGQYPNSILTGPGADTEHPQPASGGTTVTKTLARVCPSSALFKIVNEATLANIASYLQRTGKPVEAKRVLAISQKAQEQVRRASDDLTALNAQIVTKSIHPDWDPNALLLAATAMLGGESGLLRYMTASRDAFAAAYIAPSTMIFANDPSEALQWISPNADNEKIATNFGSQKALRGSVELPLRVFAQLAEQKHYLNMLALTETRGPVYISDKLAAAERLAREEAAKAILNDPAIPLRQTLAALVTDATSASKNADTPTDKALVLAALLPRMCLTAATTTAVMLLDTSAIREKFIPELRAEGKW